MAIFHKFFKVSRHMVYGHLIMEIYRAYEIGLEGCGVKHGIEYNVIESKIFNNAHFHGLHYEDKSKPGKYQKLKLGEKRVKGPKTQFTLKPIHPDDEDKELANIIARELGMASQRDQKNEAKKEPNMESMKEVKKGKRLLSQLRFLLSRDQDLRRMLQLWLKESHHLRR